MSQLPPYDDESLKLGDSLPRDGARSDGDSSLLQVISDEKLAGFTFEGMKRRLGTHPETLSRIIDRLEDESVLEKSADGYRVTQKGRSSLDQRRLVPQGQRVTLLRTLLPNDVDLEGVLADLKGRWFGILRWLGYSSSPEGVVLKWVTEDGGVQVDASFFAGELIVEGKLFDGRNLAEAIRASHQLLNHVSRIYSRPRANHVAFYRPFSYGDRN